jgi:hypothetical protein
MLEDTIFSLSAASFPQGLAFVGFAIFTVGFFIWVALLVRSKHKK